MSGANIATNNAYPCQILDLRQYHHQHRVTHPVLRAAQCIIAPMPRLNNSLQRTSSHWQLRDHVLPENRAGRCATAPFMFAASRCTASDFFDHPGCSASPFLPPDFIEP